MKKYALFTSLLILSGQIFCQISERQWEQGPLKWTDFRGEVFNSSIYASEMSFQLGYHSVRKRVADSTLYLFETKNYMNPELSWVRPEGKKDRMLGYNQTLFNIAELHRRRLQHDLHRISSIYLAEEKFATHRRACNYEIRQFQQQTNFGMNIETLRYWEEKIARQLYNTPYEAVPQIKDRNFGYGLNAGFGSGVFTGAIADNFRPSFNFIFGFDFSYKNTALFLNGTLAGSRVKSGFEEEGKIWDEDLKAHVAIIDVSLGQTLIDDAKKRITPFLGLGILEFTPAKDGEEYAEHLLVNYGLIYGLNYDYKFRKIVRLTPSPFGEFREKIEHTIRFKLYATSASFQHMKGTSLNFTIAYAAFGRLIRIE